jgi:hypothetical protein
MFASYKNTTFTPNHKTTFAPTAYFQGKMWFGRNFLNLWELLESNKFIENFREFYINWSKFDVKALFFTKRLNFEHGTRKNWFLFFNASKFVTTIKPLKC